MKKRNNNSNIKKNVNICDYDLIQSYYNDEYNKLSDEQKLNELESILKCPIRIYDLESED